jgi:hypothetical protein
MKKIRNILLAALMVMVLLNASACESAANTSSSPESGIIELRVTDPPPADVKTAIVHLRNIQVHMASDNSSDSENSTDSDNPSDWITILGTPASFDLMDVIGIEKILGSANVSAGKYTQIRMDVVEVTGEMTDGTPYTAEVPGDKLKIVRPFTVVEGETLVLTLDFDGEKSLIRTGNGRFMFKPVVKLITNNKK